MAALKRILYVEDDDDARDIGKYSLEINGGYEIFPCVTGEEALEEAEFFNPHLFLLDVMLPGISGVETLKALRKINRFTDVPVIFMTAKTSPEDLLIYEELGALTVIPKPYDAASLARQIEAAWAQLGAQ